MIDKTRLCAATAMALLAMPAYAQADCADELKGVMAAAMASGPFRTVTTITAAGVNMEMSGNVVPPDQFDITTAQGRMILTKQGAWMQQDGQWTKMPDVMREMVGGQVSVASEQALKNATNIQCLGEQAFEGKSYAAYEFDTTGEVMGVKATSHVTLYTESGKPAVSVIDGEAMGQKSHTIQKITYDSSITISAPK